MAIPWHECFDRWEAMQDAYVPERKHRFDVILEIFAKATDRTLYVLDLGSGPGSVALHMATKRPGTAVLAIDSNEVLLEMGRAIAEQRGARIDFQLADLRFLSSLHDIEQRFDAVVSSTALHWLDERHLQDAYRHSYQALRSGGWFVNSDHIANNDQELQMEAVSSLKSWQEHVFSQKEADTWDTFWQYLSIALGTQNTEAFRGVEGIWEGSEEGLSESWHRQALEKVGFTDISVHWRKWGDAVIAARKP